MEVLNERILHNKFIEAREKIQKWTNSHCVPSRYLILNDRQREELEEYNDLMIKFRKAEQDLENFYASNITAKQINELKKIEEVL